jgi:methylenetetrahydrofolate--tRNA-(uracil-5-)-methyltransferase
VVLASGPLTGARLAESLAEFVGRENLYFYDALAPIVEADSIDSDVVFKGSRYGKGEGHFLNCPFTEKQYKAFWDGLRGAEVVALNDIDKKCFFEGCLPVEEIASRGYETLAFGPLKPVGLADPRSDARPFAVLQLRPENLGDTMYGLVGCQTRLTQPEQKRVFRMVPGLERARFLRYGEVHRNTYIESPLVLTTSLMAKTREGLFMAGQIVGGEGYAEAIATGLLAGVNAWRFASGRSPLTPPVDTALGSLVRYISEGAGKHFSPMNFNFGLLPALRAKAPARRRKEMKAARALESLKRWKEAEWNEA